MESSAFDHAHSEENEARSAIVRNNALSSDSTEMFWLLNETQSDPVNKSKRVFIGAAIDCIRGRLSKIDKDEAREREERTRIAEYNKLVTDRLARADLIMSIGLDGAKAKIRMLQTRNATKANASRSVMFRFSSMINRLFEYFQVKNMRMEPFQLELIRGVLLRIMQNQFGDTLFEHKHALLSKLCLAPLGSETYDHTCPNVSYEYHVEKEFVRYANPYTLWLAPRQRGKSLMMRVLLAAVLLHLDINVMIQAQNKHMCTMLRLGVKSAMEELQRLSSYAEIKKTVEILGNPENRVYKFDPGYKGVLYAHFL